MYSGLNKSDYIRLNYLEPKKEDEFFEIKKKKKKKTLKVQNYKIYDDDVNLDSIKTHSDEDVEEKFAPKEEKPLILSISNDLPLKPSGLSCWKKIEENNEVKQKYEIKKNNEINKSVKVKRNQNDDNEKIKDTSTIYDNLNSKKNELLDDDEDFDLNRGNNKIKTDSEESDNEHESNLKNENYKNSKHKFNNKSDKNFNEYHKNDITIKSKCNYNEIKSEKKYRDKYVEKNHRSRQRSRDRKERYREQSRDKRANGKEIKDRKERNSDHSRTRNEKDKKELSKSHSDRRERNNERERDRHKESDKNKEREMDRHKENDRIKTNERVKLERENDFKSKDREERPYGNKYSKHRNDINYKQNEYKNVNNTSKNEAYSNKVKKELIQKLYKEESDKEDSDEERLLNKYKNWGKGLKQVEDKKRQIEDDQYEMSKPLTRYRDDEDLIKHLKEKELAEDPMLEYMRKRKKKKERDNQLEETGEYYEMPRYKSKIPPPENRFNIWPGYRWDGVNRSNGFELKLISKEALKSIDEEEAYKWSTADM